MQVRVKIQIKLEFKALLFCSVLILAVFFEQGLYDQCIEECEKAVEVGREHRADFKLIAKYVHKMDSYYC